MSTDYEICSSTLLLLYSGKAKTKVYEWDDEFFVYEKSTKIVDKSCKYFGSSLEGRQVGTKNMISTSVKAPILIEESKNVIFFPTSSPRIDSCSWISYNNLLRYKKIDANHTRLFFINNREIDVDVSYNIIDNQVTRCIKLERVILKRKKSF